MMGEALTRVIAGSAVAALFLGLVVIVVGGWMEMTRRTGHIGNGR